MDNNEVVDVKQDEINISQIVQPLPVERLTKEQADAVQRRRNMIRSAKAKRKFVKQSVVKRNVRNKAAKNRSKKAAGRNGKKR